MIRGASGGKVIDDAHIFVDGRPASGVNGGMARVIGGTGEGGVFLTRCVGHGKIVSQSGTGGGGS